MLENFTDEEIGDLLDIGYLHHRDGRQIETVARENSRGVIVGSLCEFRPALFGETATPYRSLADLLLCEYITFEDLRKEWRYHGVLLGNKTFCDKLVHDPMGCPCGSCTNRLTLQ